MSISLVPFQACYAELLIQWREDPVVKKYNPLYPSTIESLGERLSRASANFSDFDKVEQLFWFIQAEERLIGNISLRNINKQMLTAEIGYAVAPEARGQRHATAAVRMVTENAFRITTLRKLIAYVHEGNLASRRVLEKVGYRPEGLLREHYLVGGIPANEVLYGILRREAVGSAP